MCLIIIQYRYIRVNYIWLYLLFDEWFLNVLNIAKVGVKHQSINQCSYSLRHLSTVRLVHYTYCSNFRPSVMSVNARSFIITWSRLLLLYLFTSKLIIEMILNHSFKRNDIRTWKFIQIISHWIISIMYFISMTSFHLRL